ncbi:cupin domain-containing protein [Nocardioides anomalus]|uniref:Cupin domain-containing protein n=1 Tax=Nocardioides anomalus TaxID=2712223 RepID=A0A6G6WDR9_9ACTN|nr:phosphomannose isomerase type II C-terminal cupin domain [Nocardioides anomalus]QIG43359.1 cupin domain-containing protein [Nocardioides anomalus]
MTGRDEQERPAAPQSGDRPWGSWHVLDEGDGYKVKRIQVDPDRRLSYQTHQFRAEHWFVVSGTATCVISDEVVVLEAGQSIDVAVGEAHRITNVGTAPLVLVEVQSGSYTGEDDIVRLEDDYGRVDPVLAG